MSGDLYYPWDHMGSYKWLEFGLFSTIIAIIRACACWALFVVTLTNTVHLIYIHTHIYIYILYYIIYICVPNALFWGSSIKMSGHLICWSDTNEHFPALNVKCVQTHGPSFSVNSINLAFPKQTCFFFRAAIKCGVLRVIVCGGRQPRARLWIMAN